MLPALGPEPTRRGSIHGGIADHFLHGVAPSAATSTLVGVAATLALALATALLLLSLPCLVCSCSRSCSRCCSCSCLRCCSDLATLQSTESTFGSVDFQGVGGLTGVKEEPAAAGRGARRRGTPLSILGFRVGAGGLEGWPRRRWRVVVGRQGGAGASGSAGGGWRLRGVQVEDELQALPKLHVKCLFATIAFSFDSSIQIPQ